MIDQFLMA